MGRPWSREPCPVAGWGVVWPLLAMMIWMCKSLEQDGAIFKKPADQSS